VRVLGEGEAAAARLRRLVRRRAALDAELRRQVEAARAAGLSWAKVGAALGVSREAAWKHYR